MCWLLVSVLYVLKALFFLFWDGLKALASPFRKCRPRKDYGEEICLVTGAAQGLGRLLALKLAERNAVLVIWDIQKEKLEEVADEIKEIGSKVYPYVCDCSSRNDIYETAKKVKKEVGPVSVLVNNAGIVRPPQTILESNDTDIKQTFKVNTLAHIWTVKAFLPWMLENNYGYIVQVASVLAFIGVNKISSYCASKAAAYSLSESLCQELRAQKKNGISVTCVCPFQLDTDMFTGVTSNFPSLLPPLRSEFVADRILQAMEERQFDVCMPRSMYHLRALKSIVPTRTMDAISDMLGVHKAMDGFQTQGSKKNE